MDLNLSGWIDRRKRDVGPYADHIIKGVTAYETRIEQIERELATERLLINNLYEQIAAEKALADDLAEVCRAYFDRDEVSVRNAKLCVAVEAYRKARVL